MEPYLPPHALRRLPRRRRRRRNQAPPQTEYCFFAMMACVIEDSTTDVAPMSQNLGVVNDRKVCQSTDTSMSPTKMIRWLAAIGLWKQTSFIPAGVVLRNFCGSHPTWLVLILVVSVLVLVLAWAKRHESTARSLWLLAILVLTIGSGLYRVTVYAPFVCEQNHRAWRHVATVNGRFACDLCGKAIPSDQFLYGCQTCNWDACQPCADLRIRRIVTIVPSKRPPPHQVGRWATQSIKRHLQR